MHYTKFAGLTALSVMMSACQTTSNEPYTIQTEAIGASSGKQVAEKLEMAAPMTASLFTEIITNIPETDKFDSFETVYGNYINSLGVYYTDVTLDNWLSYSETFQLPPIILSSEQIQFSTYPATNGYGAQFSVSKFIVKDDRVEILNPELDKISTEKARTLDGTTARLYYKLTNKDKIYGNISHKHYVCMHQLQAEPTSINPLEIWDDGCKLHAQMVAVKSLKNNELLPMKKASYSSQSNYNILDRVKEALDAM